MNVFEIFLSELGGKGSERAPSKSIIVGGYPRESIDMDSPKVIGHRVTRLIQYLSHALGLVTTFLPVDVRRLSSDFLE